MSLALVPEGPADVRGVLPFEAALDRGGRRFLRSRIAKTEFVRDQILAREGETLDDLLLVDAGVLKLSKQMPDGRRQIVAFRVDGDVLSMHRCDTPWPATVQAVTAGTLVRVPWDALRQLGRGSPALEGMLLDLAGDEIAALQSHLLALGRKTTEEKLASFLLSVCRPNSMQSRQNREFHLPMRRSDIADYLGLTTESVSREFSRLRRERVLGMPKPSRIVLLNRPVLEGIAAGRRAANTDSDGTVEAV